MSDYDGISISKRQSIQDKYGKKDYVICWACYENGDVDNMHYKYITAKHLISKHSERFTDIKTAVEEYKELYPNALIACANVVREQFNKYGQESLGKLDELISMDNEEIKEFIEDKGGLYNWSLYEKIKLFWQLDKMKTKLLNTKRKKSKDIKAIKQLSDTQHRILKEICPSKESDKEQSMLTPSQEQALAKATVLLEKIQDDFKVAEPSDLIREAYVPSR